MERDMFRHVRIPINVIGGSHATGGTRIIARLFDIVIDLIAMIPILIYAFSLDPTAVESMGEVIFLLIVGGYALTAIIILEVIVPYFTKGQTLGKKAMGIRMIEMNGSRVRFSSLMKRYGFQWVLSSMGNIPGIGGLFTLAELVILIVSVVFLFNDPYGQAVWDKIAGTVVIEDRTLIYLKRKYEKLHQERQEQEALESFNTFNLDDNRPIFKETD